jgi:hypothetical protein
MLREPGHTTYPCDSMATVLVDSGRNDIRARSVTFVVWVAEKSMDCRSSVIISKILVQKDLLIRRMDLLEA